MKEDNNIDKYFSGNVLWGDDFSPDELTEWFTDEMEAYANLGSKDRTNYEYSYHGLNTKYGYSYIGNNIVYRAFGLGSAYGDEFLPIISRIKRITIMEPSEALHGRVVAGVPIDYIRPDATGAVGCPDNTFDLITCFGALHHIANVSFEISELGRCLKQGGIALVREPIVSMGDWRMPRNGLTKRERGIPLQILYRAISDAGLRVRHEHKCMFSLTRRLAPFVKGHVYNSRICLLLDNLLCRAFSWNVQYHPRSNWQKLRATCVFFVLCK